MKASSHKTNQWGEAGGNIDKRFQAPGKKITLFLIDFETLQLKFLKRVWKVLCEASCSEIFPAPSLSLTSFISLAGKELMVVQASNFILALNSSSWASPPWIALQLPFRSIYSFNLSNIPYRRELPCLTVCRRRTWFQAFQPVISSDTLSSQIIRNSNHSAFTCSRPVPLQSTSIILHPTQHLMCYITITLLFSFLLPWRHPYFFADSFCFEDPK